MRRRTKPRRQRSLGETLVATGVRSIVAALPFSSVISPIAELFLTSFGYTKEQSKSNGTDGQILISDVYLYGVSGLFGITYVNILARSPMVDTTEDTPVWVDIPYRDGRLIDVTITARPGNPLQKRQGRWAMAFVPRREIEDKMSASARPFSLRFIEKMEGSVVKSATQTLSLRFRPQARDGFVSMYNPLEQIFGYVAIAFQDDVRSTYVPFTAEEFAPSIQVAGKVALRTHPLQSVALGYHDQIWSYKASSLIYSQGGTDAGKTFTTEWNARIQDVKKTFSISGKAEAHANQERKKIEAPWVKNVTDFEMLSLNN